MDISISWAENSVNVDIKDNADDEINKNGMKIFLILIRKIILLSRNSFVNKKSKHILFAYRDYSSWEATWWRIIRQEYLWVILLDVQIMVYWISVEGTCKCLESLFFQHCYLLLVKQKIQFILVKAYYRHNFQLLYRDFWWSH